MRYGKFPRFFSRLLVTGHPRLRLNHNLLHSQCLASLEHAVGLASRAPSSTEAEITAARKWLADLTPDSVPKDGCDISYARSSGPGGQNVNK